MKIVSIECFAGISGDMFLGALVDAGVPIELLQQSVDSLGLGIRLSVRKVNRSGISAAKVDVLLENGQQADEAGRHVSLHDSAEHAHPDEPAHTHTHTGENGHTYTHRHEHSHSDEHRHSHIHGRSLSDIRRLIEGAELLPEVKGLAIRAFELLGTSEAKIHNVPIDEIHFHEVGAVDAIADIVGAAAGCVALGVDRWFCSALNVGGGLVECAHGTFPVPAPATLDLLAGAPVYSKGPQVELVTPTGAALLRALEVEYEGFPAMKVINTGYGAGTKDFAGFPNVVRLSVGEMTVTGSNAGGQASPSAGWAETTGVIETTIDDSNPQTIAYVADLLLQQGAAEVFRTTVHMKKGRSGVLLTVLCAPERVERLREILFRETSTIGVRYREEKKFVLARSFSSVETEWGAVRIKVAALESGETTNAAPEFEDCRRLAQLYGVPLKQVAQAAIQAYAQQTGGQAITAAVDYE